MGEARIPASAYHETMDAFGARLLAARIAAGVRIGSVIELQSDPDAELRAGDCGVVCDIEAGGDVVVDWDRGFRRAIDPRSTSFHVVPDHVVRTNLAANLPSET